MKKLFIYLLLAAIFIATIGFLSKKFQANKINISNLNKNQGLKEIKIKDIKIPVEIADTQEKRIKGLSNRESLNQDQGMLFVFENKDVIRSFWMKGMKFSLDFIWIDNDKVVQVDENAPHPSPSTEDGKFTIYTSGMPVDYVLEVNAGFVSKNNIKVGDSIDLSAISNQ